MLFQLAKSQIAYRSDGAVVVMEHETSLNSHLQFLQPRSYLDSAAHTDRILTITPVAFPVSYVLILAGCILEGGKKQQVLFSLSLFFFAKVCRRRKSPLSKWDGKET